MTKNRVRLNDDGNWAHGDETTIRTPCCNDVRMAMRECRSGAEKVTIIFDCMNCGSRFDFVIEKQGDYAEAPYYRVSVESSLKQKITLE